MIDSPLERMADAFENEDIDFPTFKYKCDKCNREANWEIMIGIPPKQIPCGCGGYLVLQERQH